jgi:hypothetical protein
VASRPGVISGEVLLSEYKVRRHVSPWQVIPNQNPVVEHICHDQTNAIARQARGAIKEQRAPCVVEANGRQSNVGGLARPERSQLFSGSHLVPDPGILDGKSWYGRRDSIVQN